MREFIPNTIERKVTDKIVFRPIKSWHSGTYAGEGLRYIPGTSDGSECIKYVSCYSSAVCSPPMSVTHRLYWHIDNPDRVVSVFQSYPGGLGAWSEWFWELLDDQTGENIRQATEAEIEADVIRILS